MRRRSTLAVCLTAVTLIATGLGLAACSVTSTDVHSYEVGEQISQLRVQDPAGKVEVTADSGTVRVTETVRYSNGRPRTSHTTDGGTLRLTNGGCGRYVHVCAVDYQVHVPAATSVDITNSAGLVRLTRMAGDLNITSDAGDVEGTGLSSAHATVRGQAGHISLRYTTAPAQVTVTNDAGAIEVRLPKDETYAVDATTDAGKTSVSVPRDPAATRKIRAHSDAGKVTIGT